MAAEVPGAYLKTSVNGSSHPVAGRIYVIITLNTNTCGTQR